VLRSVRNEASDKWREAMNEKRQKGEKLPTRERRRIAEGRKVADEGEMTEGEGIN
jgi:hypothetical protein